MTGRGDWGPHGAEGKKENDDLDASELVLLKLSCLCLVIMFLETFAIISVNHMLIIQDI